MGTVGHGQYSMPAQYSQAELYIVKRNTCETPCNPRLPALRVVMTLLVPSY
jgi:hypothetical protein